MRLETWLAQPHDRSETPPDSLRLGDLQTAFSEFTQQRSGLQFFEATEDGGSVPKTYELRRQIEQMERINQNLARQRTIFQEEYDLAEIDRARKEKLLAEKLLALADLEKSRAERLQQKRQLEQGTASILQNGLQIRQLKAQITALGLDARTEKTDKSAALEASKRKLASAIADWKQRFLIAAPIAGRVSLSKIWASNQTISAGEEALAVLPILAENAADPFKIIAKGTVAPIDFEKIKRAMPAVVALDGFAVQEVGAIEARVADLGDLPEKVGYPVQLIFGAQPMCSVYGNQLPFRPEMAGEAQIICIEKTIFSHLSQEVFNADRF